MIPRTYSDEAVVLARRNYSESDRIISLFTRHYGRVSCLAKGVRKVSSRKRGHLEVFGLINFQAAVSRGLDVLTEAEIKENFRDVRKSLRKVALAYYFMEVVGRTTRENQPNPDLFEILIDSLNRLKKEKKLKGLRLDFVEKVLTSQGFWPKGRPLPNPDAKLMEVIEISPFSFRVGKRIS